MRSSFFAMALAVATAAANSITFTNLDSIPKTIYFTANLDATFGAPTTLAIPPFGTAVWATGAPWIGNFFSVNEGAPFAPGILGEVNFADAGTVWYDVSAIVNPGDNAGVKEIWAAPGDPVSGCPSFAGRCNNAYNLPNDIQTKSTSSRDLYASVGLAAGTKKARDHARDFMAKIKAAL